MVIKCRWRSGVTWIVVMMLTGCLASLPTKDSKEAKEELNLDRIQMADSSLTCSEIAAQVSKLDEMLQVSEGREVVELAAMGVASQAANQTATDMVVRSAAQNPSTMQFIPYLSSAMSMVSQKMAYDKAIDQQQLGKAQVRKDYLVALYNERGCMRPADSYNATAKKVQEHLNKLGYSCGKPDGIIGPKTVTAITAYEVDQGLPRTGQPTSALLQHLEEKIKP